MQLSMRSGWVALTKTLTWRQLLRLKAKLQQQIAGGKRGEHSTQKKTIKAITINHTHT